MPERKKRRSRKFYGTRSHGKGDTKNKRGKGNKGGKGNAGLSKHKFTYVTKYLKGYFGKKGFVNHGKTKSERIDTINLYKIEYMANNGQIQKDEKGNLTFAFAGKILGNGFLTNKINIIAFSWSKKAEQKIKNAGGSISLPKPEAEPSSQTSKTKKNEEQ